MEYLLTLLIVLTLGAVVLKDAKITAYADEFMSVSFTNGLKGIACVLIVLAHIPEAYSNIITKCILHVGYIYVTIFFMISAYGCRYAAAYNENYFRGFWKKRLKALLIPAIIINVMDVIVRAVISGHIQYRVLLSFNHYIYAILWAYLIFWIVWRMKVIPLKYKDIVVVLLIICASLMTMYTPANFFFRWPVDSIGFVWGIVIFHYKEKLKEILGKHQIKLNIVLGILSLGFGVLYLRFKTVTFMGEYLLKVILGALILGFLLSLCYKFSFKGKWITWLGHISYEIYLFHLVVINNLKEVLPECNGGIFILIVVIFSLLGAAITHTLIQYINQMLKRGKAKK